MVYRNILLQCFSVLAFWYSGAAVTLYWFVILGSGLYYSWLFWVLELGSFTNIVPGRIYSFRVLRLPGTVAAAGWAGGGGVVGRAGRLVVGLAWSHSSKTDVFIYKVAETIYIFERGKKSEVGLLIRTDQVTAGPH